MRAIDETSERVRESRAMVVAHVAREDLRLVAQPAKRGADG